MTTLLEHTLEEVRAVVHRIRLTQRSEGMGAVGEDVLPLGDLVEPVLVALGWDIDDEQEVRRSFQITGFEDGECFALFPSGIPRILVRIRRLGQKPETDETLALALRDASASGFAWVVMTDGDEYRAYSAHSVFPAEDSIYATARVTDDCQDTANYLLELFSRERIEEHRIESLWRCRMVERQLHRSIEKLFAPDGSFVRLLHKRTTGLSSEEIHKSLARAKVSVSFESVEDEDVTAQPSESRSNEIRDRMSEAELRIATWLQQRSMDRWSRGEHRRTHNRRMSQRRVLADRRAIVNRRSQSDDIRVFRATTGADQRRGGERRWEDRRAGVERRIGWDRRRILREA